MHQSIVILTEDQTLQDTLQDALGGDGYPVHSIRQPEELETIDPTHRIALVLVDLSLPGVDVRALAHQLRRRYGAATPILAMATAPLSAGAAAAVGLVDDVIDLPVARWQLLEGVALHAADPGETWAMGTGTIDRST